MQRGYEQTERMIPLLRQMNARGGKWAVTGNHDNVTKHKVVSALRNSDFTVLENEHGIVPSNDQYLVVAGVDDLLFGTPDIQKSVAGLSDDDCVLLLVHEPDAADFYTKHPIAAQFSGHSHGGQIRIPFVGPIMTPELARKYVDGLYYVGERQMPVYVNRGIGTSNAPVRLFCRPEITVFHLTGGA
ncbi:metallophosphoesterase [Cohnella kolymensis]|uniref:metallophosphoesterase n=1 Tax=Cohnella kolymensis TaxID=1590652 RepID=UPI000AF862DB|nr:hypothetical protein [Cohnella kolymensis]